jgi:hypothetical protein
MQSISSFYRGPGTVCDHRNAGPQPGAAFQAVNSNHFVYATKSPRLPIIIRNQIAARWTPSNRCIPHIGAKNINAKNWPPRYDVQIVDAFYLFTQQAITRGRLQRNPVIRQRYAKP